ITGHARGFNSSQPYCCIGFHALAHRRRKFRPPTNQPLQATIFREGRTSDRKYKNSRDFPKHNDREILRFRLAALALSGRNCTIAWLTLKEWQRIGFS